MAEQKTDAERFESYSQKTNVNAINIALHEQRIAGMEKRLDEYHIRLHVAEDKLLTMRVVQDIHDTQIRTYKAVLQGNGERQTIPMELDRLERDIQGILKVDWREMQGRIDDLVKLRDKIDARSWQIWMVVIGLILSQIFQWLVK